MRGDRSRELLSEGKHTLRTRVITPLLYRGCLILPQL